MRRLGGPEGNERLTAAVAAALVLLLAAEGVTILRIGTLLKPHMFIGMLLLPIVGLKLASAGWRFLRYYGGSVPYRLKGPPQLLLRLLAPLLVAATLVLFGTGIGLLVVSPRRPGPLLGLHKVSFVVWFAVASVHVLAYALRAGRALVAEWRRRDPVPGLLLRGLALAFAVACGIALAIETSPLDDRWVTLVR